MKSKPDGKSFSSAELILLVVIIAIIGFVGWYTWQATRSADETLQQATTANNGKLPASKSYNGWLTYRDSGSGVSIQYPSDWQIAAGGNSAAWRLVKRNAPTSVISSRWILLDTVTTPKQEWNDCPSADSCGAQPGDSLVSSSELTINGLAAYKVTEKNAQGTYYATVIKSDKPTAQGTVFVEFLISRPDSSTLHTYDQIVRSARF